MDFMFTYQQVLRANPCEPGEAWLWIYANRKLDRLGPFACPLSFKEALEVCPSVSWALWLVERMSPNNPEAAAFKAAVLERVTATCAALHVFGCCHYENPYVECGLRAAAKGLLELALNYLIDSCGPEISFERREWARRLLLSV